MMASVCTSLLWGLPSSAPALGVCPPNPRRESPGLYHVTTEQAWGQREAGTGTHLPGFYFLSYCDLISCHITVNVPFPQNGLLYFQKQVRELCELLVPHSIQMYTFNSQDPGAFSSSCSLRICLVACPLCRGSAACRGAVPGPAAPSERVGPRGPAILRAQNPAAPREAQRRPRTRSSAPSCPARAMRSGVSRPRAPPRGHGPSYTRAAKLSSAALPPVLMRSWVSTGVGASSHPGHPASVPQVKKKVKVKVMPGAHFCPLNLHFYPPRMCCPSRTFWLL